MYNKFFTTQLLLQLLKMLTKIHFILIFVLLVFSVPFTLVFFTQVTLVVQNKLKNNVNTANYTRIQFIYYCTVPMYINTCVCLSIHVLLDHSYNSKHVSKGMCVCFLFKGENRKSENNLFK